MRVIVDAIGCATMIYSSDVKSDQPRSVCKYISKKKNLKEKKNNFLLILSLGNIFLTSSFREPGSFMLDMFFNK